MPVPNATEDPGDDVLTVPPAVERRIRIAVWGSASIAFLAVSLVLPWVSADGERRRLWSVEDGLGPYGDVMMLALMVFLPLSVAAVAVARRGPSIAAAVLGGLVLAAESLVWVGLVRSDALGVEVGLLVSAAATASLVLVHLHAASTTRHRGGGVWTRPADDPRARLERFRHMGM